jgi:hypothetical protein
MQRDYQSGDPYLAFAKRAGAVPADATKKTHGKELGNLPRWKSQLVGVEWLSLRSSLHQPRRGAGRQD